MIRAAIDSIRDELICRWVVFPLATYSTVETITDGLFSGGGGFS